MVKQPMQSLPRNARFIGPDGQVHIVFTPAAEHPDGWVVTDRGFFDYKHPVEVEVTYRGNVS